MIEISVNFELNFATVARAFVRLFHKVHHLSDQPATFRRVWVLRKSIPGTVNILSLVP
jgi:hypothetical protein